MLGIGETAPEFEAPTSSGSTVRLSSLRGRPVVLFFYPQADTPGCTVETKGFRDLHPDLARSGVQVLGISTDDVEAQRHFSEKCSVPFPLVADPSKRITEAFGVLGRSGRARRVSFFLDPEGRVVETVDTSAAPEHVARARARYLSRS